jgi:hypothetical protein
VQEINITNSQIDRGLRCIWCNSVSRIAQPVRGHRRKKAKKKWKLGDCRSLSGVRILNASFQMQHGQTMIKPLSLYILCPPAFYVSMLDDEFGTKPLSNDRSSFPLFATFLVGFGFTLQAGDKLIGKTFNSGNWQATAVCGKFHDR